MAETEKKKSTVREQKKQKRMEKHKGRLNECAERVWSKRKSYFKDAGITKKEDAQRYCAKKGYGGMGAKLEAEGRKPSKP